MPNLANRRVILKFNNSVLVQENIFSLYSSFILKVKMESKDELKEIDVKNRTCYFDNIMRVGGISFSDILLDKKSHENILIYDIS